MLAKTYACGLNGVNGFLVEVEAFNAGSDKIAAKMIFTGVPTQE